MKDLFLLSSGTTQILRDFCKQWWHRSRVSASLPGVCPLLRACVPSPGPMQKILSHVQKNWGEVCCTGIKVSELEEGIHAPFSRPEWRTFSLERQRRCFSYNRIRGGATVFFLSVKNGVLSEPSPLAMTRRE